jgi:hypothetical protein
MIDPRERYSDLEETIRTAFDGFRAGMWGALPGIVVSYDSTKLTVVVQPAIQGVIQKSDGSVENVNLPLLSDVPVHFPRGGGCTLTFPIYPGGGDECLVVFSSRCIDSWWQNGGVGVLMEPRMHDLSDGFAFIGPFSQATKISNVSTTTVQLRADDHKTYIELDPTGQIVNIVAPGGVNITAPLVNIQGAVAVSKTIAAQQSISTQEQVVAEGNISSAADVLAKTVSLHGHAHSAVATGLGVSGPPVP